jgi:hypothetical protein
LPFPHFRICPDTIMPVAHQKHSRPLDTDFRGDSMNKNKLFGEDVTKKPRRFLMPASWWPAMTNTSTELFRIMPCATN